jgi:hypothetical protein
MTSRRHLRLTHLLGRFHEATIYVTLLVVLKDDEIVDHTLTSPRLSLARLFRACSPAAARLSIGSHCGFSRLAVTEFWVLRYASTQVMSREGPILPRNGSPVHSHLSGLYSAPAVPCFLGRETRGEFGILRQGASEPLCAKIGDLHT